MLTLLAPPPCVIALLWRNELLKAANTLLTIATRATDRIQRSIPPGTFRDRTLKSTFCRNLVPKIIGKRGETETIVIL